jgi:hypothetical protein
LLQIGKTSGYRFQIKEITAPEVWQTGANIHLITLWENVGVSPHYEPTVVLFQLYDRINRRYVWGGISSVNLETLFPTGKTPATIEDIFTLPADLAPGSYELRLMVVDPQFYRQPLKLAITGDRSDGSYRLGNIMVGYSQ